jgi:hypothetical protein
MLTSLSWLMMGLLLAVVGAAWFLLTYLSWLMAGLMVAAVGAIGFRCYPTGRLPKRRLWLLTTVAFSVCFAFLGGLPFAFQWGYEVAFAVIGTCVGIGGAMWAEWPSISGKL